MIFFIVWGGVTYLLSAIIMLLVFIDDDFYNSSVWKKILICTLCLTPLNIPFLASGITYHVIKEFIIDNIENFFTMRRAAKRQRVLEVIDRERMIKITRDYEKRKQEIQLKEREEKIKKGIIRVSESDPYGEENWIEEDLPHRRNDGGVNIPHQPYPPPDRIRYL